MSTDPTILVGWIVGGFWGLVFWAVLGRLIESAKSKRVNRTLTTVAITNGLLLELGFTPLSTFASGLVPLTPWLTSDFPSLVQGLVSVVTFLDLIVGFGNMAEHGGIFGAIAFVLSFTGGMAILYSPTVGVFLIVMAVLIMEVAV